LNFCKHIYTSGKHNYLYTHRGESSISFLKSYGLYDYFSDFVTLQSRFARKPSPDAINYLINKHDMTQNESIMIGDRDLDILSVKNHLNPNKTYDNCIKNKERFRLIKLRSDLIMRIFGSSKKESLVPKQYKIKGKLLVCPICGGTHFDTRKTLLTSSASALMNLEWTDTQADNYICSECGYIYWFLPKN
jgi:hypothetical protein